MSDNGEVKKEEVNAPVDFELRIKFSPDGQISLNGHLENEILCIYILEKAKDIVKGYNLQQKLNAQKIVKPHGMMNFARNVFNK
jgi:hypothetical protein